MNSNMRRTPKLPLIVIFTIGLFLTLFVVESGRIQEPKIISPKSNIVINKVLSKHIVDLNKPIVDVSGWQIPAEMDYNTISQQIIGAIVRVQTGKISKADGAAEKSGLDKQYVTHIENFQERGIPVAVYAFVTGKNKTEMKEQAKDFYDRSKAYNPTYYWVDVEAANMKDMDGGVEAFRSELEKLGAKNIGIYTQGWFLEQHKINPSKFTALWMADYGLNTGTWNSSPDTNLKYQMHQYTDQGILNGHANKLDLNLIRTQEDYNKLFRFGKDHE